MKTRLRERQKQGDVLVKKVINLVFVILITIVSPFIAAYIANSCIRQIHVFDANNYYVWITIHHIIQGLLGVVLLKIVFRNQRLTRLGFNFGNKETGSAILKYFFVVWTAVIALFFLSCGLFYDGFAQYISDLYPLKLEVMLPKFIIELLLIIALGEEPIFRAFVSQVLEMKWKKTTVKIGKIEIPVIYIISSVLFSISHANYDIFPFRIIHVDPIKLLLNLVFGYFLVYLFDKTRSIFYTTIAHAYSNVLIYSLGFLTTYLVR